MSVYLSVSLLNISKTTRQTLINFYVHVTVAVAVSFSDTSGIRYVLPVLWMLSRFLIMALWRVALAISM